LGKIAPYISLIRFKLPPIQMAPVMFVVSTVLSLIVSSIKSGIGFYHIATNIFLSIISVLTTSLAFYIYNDLTDIEVDKTNNLNRPLSNGKATKNNAQKLIVLLTAIGLSTAFIMSLNVFLLVTLFYVLFFFYSYPPVRLKNIFLVKNLTIAVGTTMTYFIGSIITGTIPTIIYLMAVLGFMVALSTSMLNDLRDVIGDKKYNTMTVPVVWGPSQTLRFAIALILSTAIATVVGYFQLGFNLAFPLIASCAFIAWIVSVYPLFRSMNDQSFLTANVRTLIVKKIPPICIFIQLLTIIAAVL